MSQENVAIVRRTIEARNRDLDEWTTFFHPDVEGSDSMIVAGMAPETHGIDELRREVERWDEGFLEWREEVLGLDDRGEVVVAEVRFHGRGGASGASVTSAQVDFYRVREGRIVEYRSGYRTREEALAAAGLSE